MLTDESLKLGRVVCTRSVLETLRRREDDPDMIVMACDLQPLLERHAYGDWGRVADPAENQRALTTGDRILSVYDVRGTVIWIITDGESDACPACWAGVGVCEPEKGSWVGDEIHFRDDLPPRRLTTTVLLPRDY